MRIDFRIPKIPAVAMAPTPTKRTYPRKICVAVICAMGICAGYTALSEIWLPIIQISGTSTRFERTPPAHRISELRSPITYPSPRMKPMASKLNTILARSASVRTVGMNRKSRYSFQT